MSNKILILSGFSGAGKDTIAEIIHKNYGMNFIISHTTRPMRDYESEGKPYYFIDKNTMLEYEKNNQLIESRKYNTTFQGKNETWIYGVHKSEIQKDRKYIGVLDVTGLKKFKEYFGDRVVSIFITVPDEIREERAMKRGSFDKVEWDRRIKDDKEKFNDQNIKNEFDHIVENIDLEDTISKIISLI